MRSCRFALIVALATAIVTAGCGGDDEESPADTAAATAREDAATSTPSGTEAESESPTETEDRAIPSDDDSEPAGSGGPAAGSSGGCLKGSWVSSSFTGRRGFESPFGKIALSGRGKGLGLDFRGNRWRFHGVGDRPMRGRALGIRGTLKVNGSARGRLVDAGGRVRFRQTGTSGTVTLAGLGNEFELPVSVVAAAIVPDGPARARCGDGRLTIDSRSGVLRLSRAG